jgi:hypothetical protein
VPVAASSSWQKDLRQCCYLLLLLLLQSLLAVLLLLLQQQKALAHARSAALHLLQSNLHPHLLLLLLHLL